MNGVYQPDSGAGAGLAALELVPFCELDRPGAYVLQDEGLLLRVPPDALAPGRSPLISLSGQVPVMVARISDDPWIPISRARTLAADHDLAVRF